MADKSKTDGKSEMKIDSEEVIGEGSNPQVNEGDKDDNENEAVERGSLEQPESEKNAGGKKKKKLKKKRKGKQIDESKIQTGTETTDVKDVETKPLGGLSQAHIQELMKLNPNFTKELASQIPGGDLSSKEAGEAIEKLSIEDIMATLRKTGKDGKEMASYKFWGTQPVPKFDDLENKIEEGPIREIDPERIRKQPDPLPDTYEWVTMDLLDKGEMQEVYTLLSNHYVEDEAALFRFNYSSSFLSWALTSPGWTKEWHVGVRAKESKKLVAFISASPVELRVRKALLKASEVNFLVIHKKLRGLRLAPVLIKEITRRCNLLGVYQALYTGGVLLPTPVSTCRYFHRALNWQKLYECGFSNLPPRSKPQYQVHKYALPDKTATKGLRVMEAKDVDSVLDLLNRYLARTDMAPIFTKEEIEHWLLYTPTPGRDQVIWSYVVEDPGTKKITDYFSFFSLPSTIIGNSKHGAVNAAYLFYYASETALPVKKMLADATKAALKGRLNALMNDSLILAKTLKFDVFNALTLLDNGLFLEQQKFGKGDGQLHYYLYNYNANKISGGINEFREVDESQLSGIGVVML